MGKKGETKEAAHARRKERKKKGDRRQKYKITKMLAFITTFNNPYDKLPDVSIHCVLPRKKTN